MRRRVPLWLKIGYTAWVLVWIPFYWHQYGPQNFLWFCDIANLLLAAALWGESRLIFSWQAVSVLGVQIVYTFDVLWRAVWGWHPVGGSEYVFDPAIPLHIRLMALFHVAVPALLVWGLLRLRYDRRALAAQTLTAWLVLPASFVFGAGFNLNWTWGPFGRAQTAMDPGLYLILCMVGFPLLIYLPSHLILRRLFRET